MIRYRLARKQLRPPEQPDRHGFVLDAVPELVERARPPAVALPEWEAL
jgi:hypothetical protein